MYAHDIDDHNGRNPTENAENVHSNVHSSSEGKHSQIKFMAQKGFCQLDMLYHRYHDYVVPLPAEDLGFFSQFSQFSS